MPYTYPVMLDVSDRLAVIIGGGAVAVRKAKGLLVAGATRVRVVSPVFHTEMPDAVERRPEPYDSRHLEGAELVFAATDAHDVNDRVVRDARERGVLVNRADEGEVEGDFVLPARLDRGPVIATVSAGSPALSAAIRDDLAKWIDGRHVKMAEAMSHLRPAVRHSGLPQDRRREVFRDLVSDAAFDALVAGGEEQLRRWIVDRHPDLKL